MDEMTLQELLEQEYRETLEEVRLATDDGQLKRATTKLSAIHKHLMEMRIMETNNELKTAELEFKKDSAAKEMEVKKEELGLKNQELTNNYYHGHRDLDIKEKEQKIREAELKSEKHNRIITWIFNGITVITGGASLYLTNRWLKQTMIFEETGTFTSKSGKFVSDMKRMFGRG